MPSNENPTPVRRLRSMSDLQYLAETLAQRRFSYTCEKDLQEGLEQVLRSLDFDFEREYMLTPRDKVDFFLKKEGIGVELKVKGSKTDVMRQLMRYATNDQVKSLVLVTTVAKHRGIPLEMQGKPIRIQYLSPL
jgi:hypothetical protein